MPKSIFVKVCIWFNLYKLNNLVFSTWKLAETYDILCLRNICFLYRSATMVCPSRLSHILPFLRSWSYSFTIAHNLSKFVCNVSERHSWYTIEIIRGLNAAALNVEDVACKLVTSVTCDAWYKVLPHIMVSLIFNHTEQPGTHFCCSFLLHHTYSSACGCGRASESLFEAVGVIFHRPLP